MRFGFLLVFLFIFFQNCQKYGQKPAPALAPDAVARIENGQFVLLKTQTELTRRVLALLEAPVVVERHEVRYSDESRRYYLRSTGYGTEAEQSKTFGFILKEEAGSLLIFDPAYVDCIHFCIAVEPCLECDIIIYEPCKHSSAECSTADGHANVGVIFKNVKD